MQLVYKARLILDIGCGPGHFINSLNYHYQRDVYENQDKFFTGLDFNPTAINYAREVSGKNNLDTKFVIKNVFDMQSTDFQSMAGNNILVISIGALHHTVDCIEAITKILQAVSANNTKVTFLIGLYHLHGRAPFLSHFESLKEQGWPKDKLFSEFTELRGSTLDTLQDESWFEDQVLHPRESQHTLQEINPVFEQFGLYLHSTSINRFGRFKKPEDLFASEIQLKDIAEAKLSQRTYFSGFFTCLFKNY
jgi:SAM-dependent methyltransferase